VEPLDPNSDEALAIRVQHGDTDAFGTLVERFEPKLLRYGTKFLSSREDTEDIVQEVFLSVYQNIKSFDSKQRFSPWIYRIAHNAFVNGLRKKQRSPFIALDFDTLVAYVPYDDPAQAEREQTEMRKMIDLGLNEIPSKYREILILYYLEEQSYKEIADILQVPTGTVGIRLKRAKEALMKAYEKLNLPPHGY
jgi:RNA polymerase sigma-70 factor (ECF subfamily)